MVDEASARGADAPEPAEEEPTVEAFTADSQVEAMAVQAALEAEGVPLFVRPYEESAYDGLFAQTKGWAKIFVYERDLPRAKNVIEAVLSEAKERAEEMEEEETEPDSGS